MAGKVLIRKAQLLMGNQKIYSNIIIVKLCIFVLFARMAIGISAYASPALPGSECKIRPYPLWSEQEKWIWQQTCKGEIADLAKHYGGSYDAREHNEWPKNRLLTPQFLETVLLYEPWRTSIHRQGIYIVGAKFNQPVNLKNASLEASFQLKNCAIPKIDMSGIRAKHFVSFSRSSVSEIILQAASIGDELDLSGILISKLLNLSSIDVMQNVFLRHATVHEINLRGANIGGQLTLNGIYVADSLNMDAATVKRGAYLTEAEIKYANIRGANIDTQLSLDDTKIVDLIDMQGLIAKEVLIRRAQFSTIDFRGANISEQLDLDNTTVTVLLDMDNTTLGGPLYLRSTHIKEANLIYLSVKGILDLSNGHFQSVDLTGSHITQDLILGSKTMPPPIWDKVSQIDKPQLILRNTSVNGIQDREETIDLCISDQHLDDCRTNAWPEKIELDGFKFTQIGAIDVDQYSDMSSRKVDWWINWINRHKPISLQPYQIVAIMLRNIGKSSDADELLYASKNAERTANPTILLWSQWALIGYGFYPLRSTLWIVGLVLLGVLIMRQSGEANKVCTYPLPNELYQHRILRRERVIYWIDLTAFSFDMLLPIIRLREAHYEIDLDGWARYYFYFHRLTGWILSAFLIAGISGLMK